MASLLLLALGTGVPFYLLYNRHKPWLTVRVRLVIAITATLIALSATSSSIDYWLAIGCAIGPVGYLLNYSMVSSLSNRVQGRPFFLWLRHSDDIDDSLFAHNPHVSNWDRAFSIYLLMANMCIPLLPVLISK